MCRRRLQDGQNCHGCNSLLCPKRRHCSRCGKVYCKVCCAKFGQCARSVPRALLGTTDPATRDEATPVCNDCFLALKSA